MHIVFFVCALASIAAVVLICLFLFANGIPAMKEIGLLNFLTGAKWKPGNDIYGILPMILGSIYITAGAVVIGVPVGFVNVVPSKELIISLPDTPYIVARGRKGGSNVAAAICGETDRCALHALAQSAVLVNAHAADRRLGL